MIKMLLVVAGGIALLVGSASGTPVHTTGSLIAALQQGHMWDRLGGRECEPSIRACETVFSHRSAAHFKVRILSGATDDEWRVWVEPDAAHAMLFNRKGVCDKGCAHLSSDEGANLGQTIIGFVIGRIVADVLGRI